jgi:hypothetical protein
VPRTTRFKPRDTDEKVVRAIHFPVRNTTDAGSPQRTTNPFVCHPCSWTLFVIILFILHMFHSIPQFHGLHVEGCTLMGCVTFLPFPDSQHKRVRGISWFQQSIPRNKKHNAFALLLYLATLQSHSATVKICRGLETRDYGRRPINVSPSFSVDCQNLLAGA